MKIVSEKMNWQLKRQAGLSLVELLVSMVIGLFLLGGVITNFISTKDSDKMREAVSEMDASAHAAFSVMRQTIMHSGYPSIHNILIDKGFYTESDPGLSNPLCRGGGLRRDISSFASINSNRLQTKDRSRGDVITVVLLADNPCLPGKTNCSNDADANPKALVYTDCMGGGETRDTRTVACSADADAGMDDPGQARIYSSFKLGGGNNSRTLYCVGSRGGTQPLADNIEAMQILYGFQRDDGSAIYQNADAVDASNSWGGVTSVQIALLIRSSGNVLKQASSKTKYTLLDSDWTIPADERRRLYRVYTTTIHLANQNKGGLL